MRIILWLMVAGLILGGCATKRYGRMQEVTRVEEDHYTCEDIDIELAKITAFRKDITDAEVDGRSVLGFLGDFGIGNAMEKDDALDSAAEREEDLIELKADKRC